MAESFTWPKKRSYNNKNRYRGKARITGQSLLKKVDLKRAMVKEFLVSKAKEFWSLTV